MGDDGDEDEGAEGAGAGDANWNGGRSFDWDSKPKPPGRRGTKRVIQSGGDEEEEEEDEDEAGASGVGPGDANWNGGRPFDWHSKPTRPGRRGTKRVIQSGGDKEEEDDEEEEAGASGVGPGDANWNGGRPFDWHSKPTRP